jgi:hypothetical protein
VVGRSLAVELEDIGVLGQRRDDEVDVLVEVDARDPRRAAAGRRGRPRRRTTAA